MTLMSLFDSIPLHNILNDLNLNSKKKKIKLNTPKNSKILILKKKKILEKLQNVNSKKLKYQKKDS